MKFRAALVVLAAIVLVAGLYAVLRGVAGPSDNYVPQARTYHVVVGGGRLRDGPTVLDATQGDQVTLEVSVDKPSILHLDGYEKLLQVQPGSDGTVSFTAGRAGFFALTLHNPDGSEATLAALQVQPRP
jgi:hypothetical protein